MEFPRVTPFDARIRHLTKLENYAYQCPHCKMESLFTLDEIKHHHGTESSRLPPDAQRLFDLSYPIRNYLHEFYYDFTCPGCTSPVRVFFDAKEKSFDRWEYFGSFVMELRTLKLPTPIVKVKDKIKSPQLPGHRHKPFSSFPHKAD